MSNKTHTTFLGITAFFSVGVLSGCEYCTPLLAACLAVPLVSYTAGKFNNLFQSTALEG